MSKRHDSRKAAIAASFQVLEKDFPGQFYAKTQWYPYGSLALEAKDAAAAPELKVKVENHDVLDVTRAVLKANPGAKVAVLNLASNYKPGGGVRNGMLAQEESLFVRTDLHCFLDRNQYPLNGKVGYSSGVSVVRDNPTDYDYREKVYKIDVITAAAIKNPDVKNGKFAFEEDLEFTTTLVLQILEAARKNGARHLVLGALGCGVYGNPPEVLASLFAEALQKYAGAFDSVTFAILERKEEYLVPIFRKVFA